MFSLSLVAIKKEKLENAVFIGFIGIITNREIRSAKLLGVSSDHTLEIGLDGAIQFVHFLPILIDDERRHGGNVAFRYNVL